MVYSTPPLSDENTTSVFSSRPVSCSVRTIVPTESSRCFTIAAYIALPWPFAALLGLGLEVGDQVLLAWSGVWTEKWAK